MHAPADQDPNTPPPGSWRSLLQNIASEGKSIAGQELHEVKREIERKSHLTKQAVILGVCATLCALLALITFTGAILYGLDRLLPLWISLLIIGTVYALGAYLFVRAAEQRLSGKESPTPEFPPPGT